MLAALVAPCGLNAQPAHISESQPWLEAAPLKRIVDSSGKTEPAARGVWKSRGYGWILAIDETGVTRYQDGVQCYTPPGKENLSEWT